MKLRVLFKSRKFGLFFFFLIQTGNLARLRLHSLVCFLWSVILMSIYIFKYLQCSSDPPCLYTTQLQVWNLGRSLTCSSEFRLFTVLILGHLTHAQLTREPGTSHTVVKERFLQLLPLDSSPHSVISGSQGVPFPVFWLESWGFSLPMGSAVVVRRSSASLLGLGLCRMGRVNRTLSLSDHFSYWGNVYVER